MTLKLGKLTLGTRDTSKSGTLAIPVSKAGKTALGRKSKATVADRGGRRVRQPREGHRQAQVGAG